MIDCQPVVRAVAPAFANPQHAPGQIGFVNQHNHIGRRAFVPLQQHSHGHAAQIHHRLRLGQHHFVAGHFAEPHERFRFRPRDPDSRPPRQRIHRQEAQVMRRPFVFGTRIAKADDQSHRRRALWVAASAAT